MLKEIAPPNLLNDPVIKALLEATDPELQKVKEQIINVIIYPRIDEIGDESLLDLLAWQFHVEGYELAETVEEKRNLVKNAIELHRYKGTKYAVEGVLESLNLSGEIREWFEYGGQPYRFKLFMKSIMSDPDLWNKLVSLVNSYKNERSWLDGIGIHREYTQVINVGSAIKSGRKYTIGLHFKVSISGTTLYSGSAFRTAKRTSIGVHVPQISTAPSAVYSGSAFRRARKTVIGVANNG